MAFDQRTSHYLTYAVDLRTNSYSEIADARPRVSNGHILPRPGNAAAAMESLPRLPQC